MNKISTIKDLHYDLKDKEILIIGDHELAGTITKYLIVINDDGTKPNFLDKPSQTLRIRVKTAFGKIVDLKIRNVFVIVQKTIPKWN